MHLPSPYHRFAWLAAVLVLSGEARAGCGAEGDDPCEIEGGTYHIYLPAGGDGPVPALVMLHGWGSSGQGVARRGSIRNQVLSGGYALVAPDGLPREGGQGGLSWSFHPDRPGPRDEIDFIARVADDAADRHGLDRNRMILGGFSIGGSMAAYLACDRPAAFAGYALVSGNFWRPHPESCAGPVRLFHTHGWMDGTVPLEGRQIRSGFAQGDIFAAMSIWRDTNRCSTFQPQTMEMAGSFWRRRWTECADEAELELALFPGGHSVPDDWAPVMLDWFEAGRG